MSSFLSRMSYLRSLMNKDDKLINT